MRSPTPQLLPLQLVVLRRLVACCLLLVGFACPVRIATAQAAAPEIEPDPSRPAAEQLDALFRDTFEAWLDHEPSLANRIGDGRAPGRMTVDLGEAHRARSRAILRQAAEALRSIPRHDLDPRRLTWAEAFHWLVEMKIELLDQPLHLLPLVPGADLPSEFGRLAGGDADLAMDSAADLRAYTSRAHDLARWVDQAIANLGRGAEQGFVHPELVVAGSLRSISDLMAGEPDQSVLQRPLDAADRLDLPAEQAQTLRDELDSVTRTVIVPAYARLHAYLRDEYLPEARDGLGLVDLDGGDEVYRSLVRWFTTSELAPDEIFELGERESRRWRRSLQTQQRLAAGSGSRYSHDRDEVLEAFRRLHVDIGARLDRLFLRRPAAALDIRFADPHMASLGGAWYQAPPPDGSRPGTFFLRPGGFDLANAQVLFLHEALPGHHFQIALAQELDQVPDFLRYGYFGAFVEGWGLYAESLGEELDLYRDPASRLGRQRFALGRAGRLVGDVGIHHLGWDLETARRQLGKRGLDWARGEVGRYATIPGQALAYAVGARKLHELRSRAEETLGEGFDIRRFHEAVLDDGPLPLVVLEAKIDRWIAAQARPAQARPAQADSADTSPR